MNQNESLKTAFGYIRVSTHMQEEISPEAQKHELQKWAKQHNILITQWFQDNGISGKKAENRTAFQNMIALAKEKDHPDYILAWKFSRFARNQEESIVYKSLLRKNNVQVVSISEPLPDGPFAPLIERIIEWMDEYYSIRLSGEVKRGMKEKAKKGGYQSAPPLGYRREKGDTVPVIYEPEAKIYRLIKKYFIQDEYNPTTIARTLNDQGYRTRQGNRFEARVVIYILRNPFYIGKIRWNRSSHGGYYENSPEDVIVSDGQHEPLCTSEEWDTISKTDKKIHTRFYRTQTKQNPFTALFIRWIISMSNLRSIHVLPKRCQQEITPCLSLLLLLEVRQRHPFRKRKCKRTKNRGSFAKFPAGVCRPRPQRHYLHSGKGRRTVR